MWHLADGRGEGKGTGRVALCHQAKRTAQRLLMQSRIRDRLCARQRIREMLPAKCWKMSLVIWPNSLCFAAKPSAASGSSSAQRATVLGATG